MEAFFDRLESILFSNLFGSVNLYDILSTLLKFVFVLIVLSYIGRIVKMIYLDISSASYKEPDDVAYFKLLNDPSRYDFPIRNEYYLADNTTIGRADDNFIVLKDPRMSKHQAIIVQQDGHYFIDDRGSTNPTMINDQPVQGPTELLSHDIVTLGDIDFAFINGAENE